jgi:translation initiation factor 2-alpha kinase 4
LVTEDVESVIARLSRTSFGFSLTSVFEEIRMVVKYATVLGVKRRILFRPWLISDMFNTGIVFEVQKGSKRSDVIASGGRYVNNNLNKSQISDLMD